MDREPHRRIDGAALVHGLAHDVDDPPQGRFAHGNLDGGVGIHDDLSAHHAVRGLHGHAADAVLAQVLLDFQRDGGLGPLGIDDVGEQGVHDLGQMIVELDVHGGSDDGDHAAGVLIGHGEPQGKYFTTETLRTRRHHGEEHGERKASFLRALFSVISVSQW